MAVGSVAQDHIPQHHQRSFSLQQVIIILAVIADIIEGIMDTIGHLSQVRTTHTVFISVIPALVPVCLITIVVTDSLSAVSWNN